MGEKPFAIAELSKHWMNLACGPSQKRFEKWTLFLSARKCGCIHCQLIAKRCVDVLRIVPKLPTHDLRCENDTVRS
jgi:hypothetical protein